MALIFKSLFILVCFSQEALAVLSRLPAGNAGPWGEQGTRGFAFEAVFKVTTSTRIFVCICPGKGLTRGWAVEGPSLTGTSPAPTGNPSLTPHTPGRVSRGLNRTAEAPGVCRGSSALPWDRAPCADTPGVTSIPGKPSLAVPSPSWGTFSPPASHSSDAEASLPRGGLENVNSRILPGCTSSARSPRGHCWLQPRPLPGAGGENTNPGSQTWGIVCPELLPCQGLVLPFLSHVPGRSRSRAAPAGSCPAPCEGRALLAPQVRGGQQIKAISAR